MDTPGTAFCIFSGVVVSKRVCARLNSLWLGLQLGGLHFAKLAC